MAAYDFPNSPSDGDTVTVSGVTYTYSSSKTRWDGAAASGSSTTVYATIDDLPLSGASTGDQAYVSGNNRLYLWNGSGWYNIALINTTPSISGASATYSLARDGTATTVTITATDPEGIPITFSVASDTSGNIATVTQGTGSNTNVFTITPSTNTSYAGSFNLTFRASDGVNIATAVSSFTLAFSIANSTYTTALITSVGADNAVNNSFDDASTSNHSITATGDVTQNSFSPYRHGGYAAYFDGSGDYLGAGGSSNNETLSGDFCIEAWIYPTGTNDGTILGNYLSGPNRGWSLRSYTSNNLYLYFQINGGSQIVYQTATNSVNPKEWNHVVWCRSGTDTSVFINGTRADNRTLSGTASAAGGVAVGSLSQGFVGYHFTGYITDARIVNGSAVYDPSQTTLAVPTERLTAVTNTSLLTCHLGHLADSSSNSHSITVNGDVKTEPYGPYDYYEYEASANGGSAFFDGSGDYLTVPNAVADYGTGEFRVECWLYPKAIGNVTIIGNGSMTIGHWSGNLQLYNGGFRDAGHDIKNNQWAHCVWQRNSSGVLETCLNGKKASTSHTDTSSRSTATSVRIGFNPANVEPYHGYIADMRVVIGSGAAYTADFAPPTAPISNITNTTLRLPFDDAGIIDKSQSRKNLFLVGNTKSSNSVTKFSSTSIEYDGTGDYIRLEEHQHLGTKDFTIECWFYALNANDWNFIFDTRGSSGSSSPWLLLTNGGQFQVGVGGSALYTGTSWTNNTWYHVALERYSGTWKLFVGGTQVYTAANTTDFNDTDIIYVARRFTDSDPLEGYMEDFRITTGFARYQGAAGSQQSSITIPTAALQG